MVFAIKNTCQASCSSHLHLTWRRYPFYSCTIKNSKNLVWVYLKEQTLLYNNNKKKISTENTVALGFREIQKGMLWERQADVQPESPFWYQQWCSLFLHRASLGVASKIPNLQLFLSFLPLRTSSYSPPASNSKLPSLESICLMN